LSPNSLVRSGHPYEEDADISGRTWIGDTKWEWQCVDMEMELQREKLYFGGEEGDWILSRKPDNNPDYMGGEEVSIELLDMKDEEVKKLLMPPPRTRTCSKQVANFKF
jgi:hypothetical protein